MACLANCHIFLLCTNAAQLINDGLLDTVTLRLGMDGEHGREYDFRILKKKYHFIALICIDVYNILQQSTDTPFVGFGVDLVDENLSSKEKL